MKKMWIGLSVVALIALVFSFNQLIDYVGEVADHLGLLEPRATITVQLPAVHTRERLMNDRCEQVAWLDEQLKYTTGRAPPALARVAQSENSGPSSATAGGETKTGGGTKAEGADSKPGKPGDEAAFQERQEIRADYRQQPNPLNWFLMLNGYRDVVRAERALAMLDDRHDLDGSELYLLSFDATVLPTGSGNGYAVIEVAVSPDADGIRGGPRIDDVPGGLYAKQRLAPLQHQDLVDLYFDWLDRTQKVVDLTVFNMQQRFVAGLPLLEGYDDIRTILETLVCVQWTNWKQHQLIADLQRDTKGPLVWPAVRAACKRALGARHTPSEASYDNTEPVVEELRGSIDRVRLISDTAEMIAERLRRLENAIVEEYASFDWTRFTTSYNRQADALKSRLGNAVQAPLVEDAYRACVTRDPMVGATATPSFTLATDGLAVITGNGIRIACTPPTPDRLPTVLQNVLIVLLNPGMLNAPAEEELNVNLDRNGDLIIHLFDQQFSRPDNPAVLDCFGAMAVLDRLNSDAGQVTPGRGERLDDFFELRIGPVKNGCAILVEPRIDPRAWKPDRPQPRDANLDLLTTMRDRLDELAKPVGKEDEIKGQEHAKAQAFSYALSPRLHNDYAAEKSLTSQTSGSWYGALFGANSTSSLRNF
jgi:hypothetical protein